jgi:hypothetical protein
MEATTSCLDVQLNTQKMDDLKGPTGPIKALSAKLSNSWMEALQRFKCPVKLPMVDPTHKVQTALHDDVKAQSWICLSKMKTFSEMPGLNEEEDD